MVYTFQDPAHLARLCRALAPAPVVVHVDAKVSLTPFERACDDLGDRVTILRERVQVNWAGFSQVIAIRMLVAKALTIARPNEYLVLLSGSDYPLRSLESLDIFFRENAGVQFIRAFAINGTERKYTSHISHRHNRDLPLLAAHTMNPFMRKLRNGVIRACDLLMRPMPMPTQPSGLSILEGGTHFAITAECARELEAMVTPEIEKYFKRVFCPEEKFYQSLIAASSFARATPAGGIEAYAGPGEHHYANLHMIDPSLIRVFDIDDWEEIRSCDKFFLRKVRTGTSDSLLDAIDLHRA